MTITNNSVDGVVIGGGPIGLWTAIQTKWLNPEKEIVILEKSSEYQRAAIRLKLDPSSFDGIPTDCPPLTKLVTEWKKRSELPIKEMESSLASCAEELGIKILRGTPANLDTLQTDYPKARVFIGADGARSGVRQHFFNDEKRFDTTLQHIAQVQYLIHTPTEETDTPQKIRKVKESMQSYKRLKFAGCFIEQRTLAMDNHQSLVTLRIFIDKSTYDSMTDATFRTPYHFDDLYKIPDSLRDTLIKWWGVQEEQRIIENKEKNKITVIRLNSTSSKEFVTTSKQGQDLQHHSVTVLVGDAAQSFPFFRSVNNGLLLGTRLAKTIQEAFKALDGGKENAEDIKWHDTHFVKAFDSYSRYATRRATMERIVAFVKNLFINLTNWWIAISARVPWQVVKIKGTSQKEAYERGASVWKALSGVDAPAWKEPYFKQLSPSQ